MFLSLTLQLIIRKRKELQQNTMMTIKQLLIRDETSLRRWRTIIETWRRQQWDSMHPELKSQLYRELFTPNIIINTLIVRVFPYLSEKENGWQINDTIEDPRWSISRFPSFKKETNLLFLPHSSGHLLTLSLVLVAESSKNILSYHIMQLTIGSSRRNIRSNRDQKENHGVRHHTWVNARTREGKGKEQLQLTIN